jgi:hypothetical protein
MEKVLDVMKNFWTPKMVHCSKFFWRRGGGGEVAEINLYRYSDGGISVFGICDIDPLYLPLDRIIIK